MRRVLIALISAAITGCFASSASTDAGGDLNCPATAADGRAIIASACANCHSVQLTGAARALAPEGIDFDTEADIRRWHDRIVVRAIDQGTMPPGAPLSACRRSAITAYLDDLLARPCTPSCAGRSCGDDGCGGSCAACPEGQECNRATGQCADAICVPTCEGRACGTDGCDGDCGMCSAGLECASGACTCAPQCAGRSCGADGCGGECGTCAPNQRCDPSGACQCAPSCTGKLCGDDGCGGSCGVCPIGETCTSGACDCVPDCTGRMCGDDGCGGSCGECMGMRVCSTRDGRCVTSCTADCTGRMCGDDGCGGDCGTCPIDQVCTIDGQCVCPPSCVGRSCGDDGCGGSCGTCLPGALCDANGQCNCVADCTGRICGDDGCGGSCGDCPIGSACDPGGTSCRCLPSCPAGSCGDDGCGGSCGGCATGQVCNGTMCEWPAVSLANDVMPIFVAAGCDAMACHAGARPAEDLDLATAQAAFTGMVGVLSTQCTNLALVSAGSPSSSYLINKLTGAGMCRGSIMPKNGPALTPAELDVVRAWIGGGAPNN